MQRTSDRPHKGVKIIAILIGEKLGVKICVYFDTSFPEIGFIHMVCHRFMFLCG
jgi:hypothetical protein